MFIGGGYKGVVAVAVLEVGNGRVGGRRGSKNVYIDLEVCGFGFLFSLRCEGITLMFLDCSMYLEVRGVTFRGPSGNVSQSLTPFSTHPFRIFS